ncbi:MAG TPA: acetyl-CoA decarbonylase/synthase complex subunit delta [Anaerolineae bacterium]|nr:acetyl-CoA decarbonylase/synthase complex subunit delta [Anaerolineae bacterium]HOR00325.1 acetyl-CoA decarbonylase/synthase complex subunit delta [Anaerolineae bacterium]
MPVTVSIPKERWTGRVREITLGATAAEGGTRSHTVSVGGEGALPFLTFEGQIPRQPVIAVEIQDRYPGDWSPLLLEAWGDTAKDVATWAKKAEELGADMVALTLKSASPDSGDTGAAEAKATVQAVLKATGLPLIVYGPGQAEKDNEVLVAAAEVAKGERIVLGNCEDKNYRTIVAAALAHGQLVVARSPIDVNLAKQLNILISDMRLEPDRILMDPTTGALGYGLEYTYSVMERLRLAALTGDSMTQQPIICTVGEEAWRTKEAKVNTGVPAAWGDWKTRSVLWEVLTATTLIEAGADIVVLRHPESIAPVAKAIAGLMAG